MDKEKIQNLAKLARIELKDEEVEELTREFGSILDYVGEVKRVATRTSATGKTDKNDFHLRNILRKDGEPHETGQYSKELLEQAPAKASNYIKVKKIL